MLLLLLF